MKAIVGHGGRGLFEAREEGRFDNEFVPNANGLRHVRHTRIRPNSIVGGWRASFRVRWLFRRFRAGPQSGSRGRVSRPRSPNPACRFPTPGSPVGSCVSHTDHRDKAGTGPVNRRIVAAARQPSCLLYCRRCVAEPVHASTTPNRSSSTPLLLHVTRSGLSAIKAGILGRAIPAGFRPSRILPHLRPLPFAGISPAEPTGARVAGFPAGGSLPRYSGGSASAMPISKPPRRSLALRPTWSLSRPGRPVAPECFSRSRYLVQPPRLLPAGATLAGRASKPTEGKRLSTAR